MHIDLHTEMFENQVFVVVTLRQQNFSNMVRIFSLFLVSMLSISVLAEDKQTSNKEHPISVGRRYINSVNKTTANGMYNQDAVSVESQTEDCVLITVYDSEGFVVYRGVKSLSSVADGFLLPTLDPAEDYTVVATIDGETYVME